MEKLDEYLKYLNIILIVVIVSTISVLYTFLSGIDIISTPNLEILLIILPTVLGGIVASFITGKVRGIMMGMFVGALSFCIWSSIYMTLLTLITSTNPGSIMLLVIWIPSTLAIGGMFGITGGFIGFIIKIVLDLLSKR